MHMPSVMGIIIIAIFALVLFGPNKLPELGRAFGKTLKEFKKGAKDIMDDNEDVTPTPPRKVISPSEVTVHDSRKEMGRQEADTNSSEPAQPKNRRLPD